MCAVRSSSCASCCELIRIPSAPRCGTADRRLFRASREAVASGREMNLPGALPRYLVGREAPTLDIAVLVHLVDSAHDGHRLGGPEGPPLRHDRSRTT